MKSVTSQHEKILLYHLFLSYISNNLSILMTGIRNNYYVVFFFVLCITMYLFTSFMYFSILFTCFFYTSIEWRVMSPCSMQVWPRFSSRVSHNNPHQLGHSRPGLYHYLFLFFLGKKILFRLPFCYYCIKGRVMCN